MILSASRKSYLLSSYRSKPPGSVADPAFSWGSTNPRRGANLLCDIFFAENSLEMKEKDPPVCSSEGQWLEFLTLRRGVLDVQKYF